MKATYRSDSRHALRGNLTIGKLYSHLSPKIYSSSLCCLYQVHCPSTLPLLRITGLNLSEIRTQRNRPFLLLKYYFLSFESTTGSINGENKVAHRSRLRMAQNHIHSFSGLNRLNFNETGHLQLLTYTWCTTADRLTTPKASTANRVIPTNNV